MLTTYGRLDVLVNNLGCFLASRHVTADGLEHTFAVIHLAPFLLTTLVPERLEASARAWIVSVSSGADTPGHRAAPGMLCTGFGAEDQQAAWKVVAPVAGFGRSPTRGAATSIHLAASPTWG